METSLDFEYSSSWRKQHMYPCELLSSCLKFLLCDPSNDFVKATCLWYSLTPTEDADQKGKSKHLLEHEYLILNTFINPVEAQWCGGAGWNKRMQCCRYSHAQGQVLCIPLWTLLSGVAQEPPGFFTWWEYVRGKRGRWERSLEDHGLEPAIRTWFYSNWKNSSFPLIPLCRCEQVQV